MSKREEQRLLAAGRSVFSTAFPNPERKGCPDAEVIRAIAFRKTDPAQHRDFIVHMSRCSPCFNDFGAFQEQAKGKRRRRGFALAAIVVLALGLTFLVWTERARFQKQAPVEVAALDLTNRGIFRGAEQPAPKPPLKLSKGRLELTIYLPIGSEPGTYELQILRQAGTAIWSGEAQALLENHVTTLHLKVDLANAKRGSYFLAVRPKGWDWAFYPLSIN